MGIDLDRVRETMPDATKAHLRKLWLRVLVFLFLAFAGIVLISWLSDTEEAPPSATCAATEVVCTPAQVADWLGFDLPGQTVQFASDAAAGLVWARFDAPAASVPNFVQNVAAAGDLVNAPFTVPAPSAEQAPWWDVSEDTGGVFVDTLTRQMVVRIDQRSDGPWAVFIAARTMTE